MTEAELMEAREKWIALDKTAAAMGHVVDINEEGRRETFMPGQIQARIAAIEKQLGRIRRAKQGGLLGGIAAKVR